MKLRERMCKKCRGLGIKAVGDEWVGRKEDICEFCGGEGTYFEGLRGYQVYRLIPEKILILDKGDIVYLYIKRADGIYLWADWTIGSIGKVEEHKVDLDNVDELEELEDDMKLLISLFYFSDESNIYCEGTPYSKIYDEGLCNICGKDATEFSEYCEEHLEQYESRAYGG